jgi:RNA polymerase sigma-70 factor (ECF subfamily)
MAPVSNQPRDILSERRLVDEVLSGNANAFGDIIKNTQGLVAQIVFKLIPDGEDRKDIVQDIYLKVFHNLDRFKFEARLSTWIGQIAYNTCFSRVQKKKRLISGDPDKDLAADDETDGGIVKKELSGILQVEIDKLPPLYQVLVGLYHHEGLSYEEMAGMTGLPVGTVKSYLFRARKRLKENLLSKYKKEAL